MVLRIRKLTGEIGIFFMGFICDCLNKYRFVTNSLLFASLFGKEKRSFFKKSFLPDLLKKPVPLCTLICIAYRHDQEISVVCLDEVFGRFSSTSSTPHRRVISANCSFRDGFTGEMWGCDTPPQYFCVFCKFCFDSVKGYFW